MEVDDDIDDEDTQKDKFLTFKIKNEEYAIEIFFVEEIVGIQKITEIPDMPNYIKGVINLRGKIIPVIDVRTRFLLDFKEYSDRTCIVIVSFNNSHIGLIVDIVSEVIKIPEVNISPPPKTNKGFKNRFVKGIGKDGENVKIILDLESFLRQDDNSDIIPEFVYNDS